MEFVIVEYIESDTTDLGGVNEDFFNNLYTHIRNPKVFNQHLNKLFDVERELHQLAFEHFKTGSDMSDFLQANDFYGINDDTKMVNITTKNNKKFLQDFIYGYNNWYDLAEANKFPKEKSQFGNISYVQPEAIQNALYVYDLFPRSSKIFPNLTNVCLFDENKMLICVARFWIDRYTKDCIMQSYPLFTKYAVDKYIFARNEYFKKELEMMLDEYDKNPTENERPYWDIQLQDITYVTSVYIKKYIEKLYPKFSHKFDILLSEVIFMLDYDLNSAEGTYNFLAVANKMKDIEKQHKFTLITKPKIPKDIVVEKVIYPTSVFQDDYFSYYEPNMPIFIKDEFLEQDIYIYNYQIYLFQSLYPDPNAKKESLRVNKNYPRSGVTHKEVRHYGRLIAIVEDEGGLVTIYGESLCSDMDKKDELVELLMNIS